MKVQPEKPIGRPVEVPEPWSLKKLTVVELLAGDVWRILLRCNAPGHWGDSEVALLINFCLFRAMFDAVEVTRTASRTTYRVPGITLGKRRRIDRNVLNALHLAKMFVEGREELLKALPRILNRINRYWREPQKRIELQQALDNEYGGAIEPMRDLFAGKAAGLADELDKAFQPGRTLAEKIVERGALHLEEMSVQERQDFFSGLPTQVRAELVREFGNDRLESDAFWRDEKNAQHAYKVMKEALKAEQQKGKSQKKKRITEDVIDKLRKKLRRVSAEEE